MAKMDELHNYAYPDKYLDELHIYDKSIGNTGNNDEIHNYGNRGVTYGVDEMHLYGSYQTVVDTSEDEVNTPKQYELIDIDEYFDEIEDMDEQQKEDRKDLAKDFRDILMLILMLMLADMTAGNPINAEFYYALTKSRMMDAVDKHVTVTATLYSKIENYIDTNVRQVIDSTIRNQEQPYFFTVERATSIAVDDAMATYNLDELDEAIKAGYKYKIWRAMPDNRVRLSHQEVDGDKVAIEKPFHVGRCLMQAPMIFDENSPFQDAKEIINCRCCLIYSNKKDNNESQNRSKNGKMVSTKNYVNTNGHRNETDLTQDQIDKAIEAAHLQGYYGQIEYTKYSNTSIVHLPAFPDENVKGYPLLVIGTDAYPSVNGITANDKISLNGCMAHEIVGHHEAWLKGTTQSNGLLEEIQASVRASKFGVGLSEDERNILMQDALDRTNKAGLIFDDIKDLLDIWER